MRGIFYASLWGRKFLVLYAVFNMLWIATCLRCRGHACDWICIHLHILICGRLGAEPSLSLFNRLWNFSCLLFLPSQLFYTWERGRNVQVRIYSALIRQPKRSYPTCLLLIKYLLNGFDDGFVPRYSVFIEELCETCRKYSNSLLVRGK